MQTGCRTYDSICDDILEGMKGSKEAMIKAGLWHDDITLEEWAAYAGSHCLLTEQEEPKEVV